jgi:hypothetical protein
MNEPIADASIARQRLVTLAEESGMSFEELVDLWSTDTAAQLALASAALAAGNLAEAARLAHGASGTSGLCGVASLAADLRNVESLAAAGRATDAQAALARAQVSLASLSGELLKEPES